MRVKVALAVLFLAALSVFVVRGSVVDHDQTAVSAEAEAARAAATAETPSSDSNPTKEGVSAGPVAAVQAPERVDELRQGDLGIEIVVEPECASSGGRLEAVLRSEPGTHVSVIVAYRDGQSFSTWYAGPMSPEGELRWPWTVNPAAAEGPGRVMVAAHEPESERSGSASAIFTVAGRDGCP